MDGIPFLISTLVNDECIANTLLDTGCLSYGAVTQYFATKNNLQRIDITPRGLTGFDGPSTSRVIQVAAATIDIDSHREQAFFYVVPKIASHDIILSLPQIRKQKVKVSPAESEYEIGTSSTIVRNRARKPNKDISYIVILAIGFTSLIRRKKTRNNIKIFAISLADIQKALTVRKKTDPRTKLPKHFHSHLRVFNADAAAEQPPLRGPEVDHAIEIEKKNGKEQRIPWGPLYNMSRDELLILRTILTKLLDKGFIRVSNSPAAAPVLFVRKPGGGLRFCVDYRGLNQITRKDRYPLPLVYEILRNIGKAKQFTKLDVVAAFHRIRIAAGDEWKTAFRTRYGLFEWMVTPFGLANAPSTFQRYINWVLRDFLDEFCLVYVDDILIYTDGTRKEYRKYVRKVL